MDIKAALRNIRFTADNAVRLFITLTLVVLFALMFPRGEDIDVDYKVGAIWAQKDVIAPFSFALLRDERDYENDVNRARQSVYPVFERVTVIEKPGSLGVLFGRIDSVLRITSKRRRVALPPADSTFRSMFSPDEWQLLASLKNGPGLAKMQQLLLQAQKEFHNVGVLDRSKQSVAARDVAIRKGTQEEVVPTARLYDESDVREFLDQYLDLVYKSDQRVHALALKIGSMCVEPNLKFSAEATRRATEAAISAVPRTSGLVQENERIVSKHERVTPEIKLKLESLARARAEQGSKTDYTLQRLGITLHVALVVLLFAIYLYLFRKRIFWNNRRLALVALLMLMEGFFAYLTRELDVSAPLEFLIFVPVASMLLTIIFDSRVGFYGTVTIALLVAGVRGNDYAIAFASIVAGSLSVYTVRDMRNRSQIFRSLGFIFLGYGLTIVALGVERFEAIGAIGEQLLYALANAVVSPVLTYGLLIFFERVFKVTTDVTLMELSQFGHPLLKRLAEQAPGTYHHSLTLATLAEAAAAAVGANEILARVGALFHDVGKLVKPMYFVENQKGSRNRHDKLTPRMSSLIISAHVKEGIALAEEYKLPQEVIDFIPMHHGTTRIEYFYNKAQELARQSEDETKIEEINEQDYRYPGPKPQTRETGILMLADAVEASTRTLEDPSPQKLEAMLDDIIRRRFEEGELDECPLTMKDLTKIKAALLNVLVGVHHTRLRYPDQPKPRVPRPRRSPRTEQMVPAPPLPPEQETPPTQ